MKRALNRTNAFVRSAKKMLRKKPGHASDEDAHHPFPRTHKLTARLQGSWARSAGYDLEMVFSFVKRGEKEAIPLESVGTHDGVY
jgi:mRNA interferase YafQ